MREYVILTGTTLTQLFPAAPWRDLLMVDNLENRKIRVSRLANVFIIACFRSQSRPVVGHIKQV